MGGSSSRDPNGDSSPPPTPPSTQLNVTLSLHNVPDHIPGGLAPHVYGASEMVGGWNPAKARPMEREFTSVWSLGFVVPSDHEPLEFKFLLKPPGVGDPAFPEEGRNKVLVGGTLEEPGIGTVVFKLAAGEKDVTVGASVKSEAVSPFVLATSYKAHREKLQTHGSFVRTSPDVSLAAIEEIPTSPGEEGLEGELTQYEVTVDTPKPRYMADTAAEPRLGPLLSRALSAPLPSKIRTRSINKSSSPPRRHRDRCVSIKDLVVLGSDAPVMVPEPSPIAALPKTPRSPEYSPGSLLGGIQDLSAVARSPDGIGAISRGRKLSTCSNDSMAIPGEDWEEPEEGEGVSEGIMAAAVEAERMLGPKERRRLAIILVGLPARGKTYTSAKLTRYLRWLGHDTKHFNVGKYRRHQIGASQEADFFRADNRAAVEQRNEVAALAMEDMLAWMEEGGQIGVYDATNSTRERREMLLKMAEGRCKMIFLETICNDREVILHNAREKIKNSPDYVDAKDSDKALEDFMERIANYERAYEPVNEGSYIKLIDMTSGSGGQMQVSNISGYLPGRIVFFLVNTHIQPRPIFLTRHGESLYNLKVRIGGDPELSEQGEKYALRLSDFVQKRLKGEQAASVWTSTLQRTMLTARHIHGFPKVQWRALDEINAGVCDGMTYAEIKEAMPDEYNARKLDKLRYRYPRGESYLDVIQRLEPVIIELERQRSPVVVVAHQAVCRALYAYFMDKPLKEVPHIEMPLHTVIELYPGANGICEKRYQLMESVRSDGT